MAEVPGPDGTLALDEALEVDEVPEAGGFAEPPLHAAVSRATLAAMAQNPARDRIRRSLRRPPVSSFI